MSPAVPLLRAPPFPGVRPAVAAVSTAAGPGEWPLPAELVALVRAARVGGTFWAPPAPVRGPVVLRARDGHALAALRARALADDHAAADLVVATDPVDPWSLLAPGVRLYAAADDEWCLLARLAGAEVAGDGTDDRALAAALLGPRYRDPFTAAAAPIERAVDILAGWRTTLDRNRAIGVATGVSWWKRDAIGRMLWSGGGALPFADDAAGAVGQATAKGGAIAVWPSRIPDGLVAQARAAGVATVDIEDGFIRSAGLGVNLTAPQSIVADTQGIYYDPTRPSDLETLLAEADLPPALLARAAALRRFIVARGISKYAAGTTAPAPLPRDGRPLVLVAGQVEDDLSVRRAGAGIAGNRALLARARAAAPDARLLFKPHPDVDAGHRIGRIPEAEALALADEVTRAPIEALLTQVDGVHVLTSLTGFEALLRGLPVTVHGQPFYAGWGLTTDLAPPLPRRGRARTLDELVAATLILYPRYLDPVTGLPCPPEVLLARMAAGEMPRPSLLVRARALQGRLAHLLGTATTRNPA